LAGGRTVSFPIPGVATLGPLAQTTAAWLETGTIAGLLQDETVTSPVLHVLRPLVTRNEDELREQANRWATEIEASPALNRTAQERLIELLTLFIVRRFTTLSR
jgi:hypothetical protein